VKTLDEYLSEAAQRHGHLCPGQVLGVRMAMLGLRELGLREPGGEQAKSHQAQLVTFVEIDRCAADAVGVVTGCSLGQRTLKFADYGKVAATFVDLKAGRAVRVSARDDSREKAKAMFPQLEKPYRQQLEAYKVMGDAELFTVEAVRVKVPPEDLPGAPRRRVACESCGEGVNGGRERRVSGRVLCRACAGEGYYDRIS
jgi:formylmethanofuran dehydrogenase subunit E